MTALEWGYEFKEAPDLENLGAVLVRKLDAWVVKGPPEDAQALADRVLVEEMIGNFIKRSRERDFAFVAVQGLVSLFKVFVEQNLAAEAGVRKRAWPIPAAPVMSEKAISETFSPAVATDGQPAVLPEPPAAIGIAASDDIRDMLAQILEKIETLQAPAGPPSLSAPPTEPIRLSQASFRYLEAERKRRGSAKSHALLAPIFGFLTDFLGDKLLSEIDDDDFMRLDIAITQIPTNKGFSLKERSSLHARYLRAQEGGWDQLERSSITTLELRYRRPLKLLFKWLREQKLYSGPQPEFVADTGEMNAVLPRDRFEEDELLTFVRCPVFTGCAGRRKIWRPGPYFFQGDLYWIFLILMFSGMRTGEPPQIALDDIVSSTAELGGGGDETLYFFDMRPYDPAQGRKALKDLKHLKTSDSARVVPIHRVLIELGLLERVRQLRERGETRLFPGWKPHKSGADEERWGKDVSRAFDYGRRLIGLTRANVSIYSLRHLLADWLDDAGAPQRLRNRILGHLDKSENAADGYGGKSLPSPVQTRIITNLETRTITKACVILLESKRKAEGGKLISIDPF